MLFNTIYIVLKFKDKCIGITPSILEKMAKNAYFWPVFFTGVWFSDNSVREKHFLCTEVILKPFQINSASIDISYLPIL